MFEQPIPYKFAGVNLELPRVFRVRQKFSRKRIADVEGETARCLESLPLPDLNGKRVALTAGSRGVAGQDRILRAVIAFLKGRGAAPFIVPAMGSHGGATAEGQREYIAGFGITEESMGVPILSGMETVQLGVTGSGFPVFCDRHAFGADYILPVHRIKPHTAFRGAYESGICKMMVIGLGKHEGASRIHRLGFAIFPELIPAAARIVIGTGKILAGLAIVENAYDETKLLEAIPSARIVERERELLIVAKESMARLTLDGIDLLVVEEIGKDISGGGMDPNVTGRPASGLPGFDVPCPIRTIAVLGLSENTHGNAAGIGMADVVTRDCVRQIDFGATYTNCLTARVAMSQRIPMIANNDREALSIGLHLTVGVDPFAAKMVQIVNTLELSALTISESYMEQVKDNRAFEILSAPESMTFGKDHRLKRMKGV